MMLSPRSLTGATKEIEKEMVIATLHDVIAW